MEIVDLSHTLSADMPVYPGTEQPVFIIGCSIEEDGFLEKKITMYSHIGTHVDAPAHLIKDARTLGQLGIGHFHGSALLLNVEKQNKSTIDVCSLAPYEKEIEKVDFLLIHTGWSTYWGTDQYFSGYSTLTVEAARWLSQFKIKGIGLDTISADVSDTKEYPIHKVFLKNDTVIIENLTNLLSVPHPTFTFSCFPLKFEYADGSPVRAVAYVE
ncbi:MAG: arylformamidase [Desulforhopalus sp.]|jgi:arylformamidase